ncbi:unnamed protein product, partial [Ceratitis capitata]
HANSVDIDASADDDNDDDIGRALERVKVRRGLVEWEANGLETMIADWFTAGDDVSQS